MVRVSALAVALLAAASAASAEPRTYRLDPERTVVTFSVRAGFSDVRGRLTGAEGTVVHDPERRAAARVSAAVPLETLTTGDVGRDRMLKGPEWFDAARHPTLRFVSESARDDGRAAVISGTVTLRGVARPLTLVSVARDEDARTLRFSAETELDRRQFGMIRLPGLVGDRVKVRIDGVAVAR